MARLANSKNKAQPQKSHFLYLSLLSVFSAIAVIFLHANGAFWGYRNSTSWAFNNIVESVFFFAVPIFFMISGAINLDYPDRYSTKTFLKKRFLKTLIPFLFWSLFALFFYSVLRDKNFSTSISGIFNGILDFEYLDIFWFFGPLFCAYLAMPLFAAIPKEKKVRTFSYITLVGIIINVLVPFIISLLNHFLNLSLKWSFSFSVVSNYLIFILIGYLLHNIEFKKNHRIIIYILAILGLLAHLIGTYFLSRKAGSIVRLFKGYQNLPSLLYSIGIFTSIKYISKQSFVEKLKKPITFLAKYTFSFYLTHRFILTYVTSAVIHLGIVNGSPAYVVLSGLATIPTCIVVIFLIRKLPGGKYILP